jgi:hypothetical protein
VVSKTLERTKIDGSDFAVTSTLGFEVDLLAFAQRLKTCALNSRDVDEHVVSTFFWLNETVALLTIKPLHSPVRHQLPPKQTQILRARDRRLIKSRDGDVLGQAVALVRVSQGVFDGDLYAFILPERQDRRSLREASPSATDRLEMQAVFWFVREPFTTSE